MERIIKLICIFVLITSVSRAAEVIKAQPVSNSNIVIKPQIVAPPSHPVQTTPSVNYVPKVNVQTTSAVSNAKPNISAHQTTPAVNNQVSPIEPQYVSFHQCTKIFPTDTEKLFYLAIASINANKFKIDEIQSKSGYILFTVVKKQFLLSIATVDKKNAIVKITPTNNNYYFPVGIVTNIFKYIELNIDTPVSKI